jgi:hypothetical protein
MSKSRISAAEARLRIKRLNQEEKDLRKAVSFTFTCGDTEIDFDGEDYFIKMPGKQLLCLDVNELKELKKAINSKTVKESLR